MNKDWYKYSEELPPVGIEVIAYNHKKKLVKDLSILTQYHNLSIMECSMW